MRPMNELAQQLMRDVEAQLAQDPEGDVRMLEEMQADQARRAQAQRRTNVESSGICVTDGVLRAVIDGTLQDTTALRAVDTWLDVHTGVRAPKSEPGRVLVLGGGTGCGKTTAAAWAIARLGGLHVHSGALADAMRSRYVEDRDKVQRVIRTRLVVVDDVGTGTQDTEAQAIERVVDHRMRSPALTIFTTNLPQDELYRYLGARTASRLAQVGRYLAIRGADLRVGAPAIGGTTVKP